MKTQFGIDGKIGKRFQKFLENRQRQILIEETKSKKSKVKSGSIQGSVLGPVFFLIFVRDISKDITANMKIFVDDAKIKDFIKTEEDVEKLQENIEKLYSWEAKNQMKFNGTKFQAVRYGPNEDLKNSTMYFTANMEDVIQQFSSIRDLGVMISDDARFETNIEKVVSKVRQKIAWVFRTFYTRREDVLKQLWKTVIQCHIDYCSQLYKPGQSRGMMAIEKLFYDYTLKIPDVRNENYWKRLASLKMYSQERRMERYRIIYIWKILEGYAPNCGVEMSHENARLGRKCKIPNLAKNGRMAIQTLREQSFQIDGARLFNCLPKTIRAICQDQDVFKCELDKFLSSIPDQPRVWSLVPEALCRITARQSNSLLAWTNQS